MGSTFTATGAVEMAGVAVARDLSGSRSTWVRGPVWDSFWMLSGLWLAPIVIWLAWGYDDPESSPLDLLYFGLTALFWLGHRFCSTYLAYCTEAYRPLLRTQSVRFVVLPVLITIGCFAFFLPPDSALPWTRGERLVGLVLVIVTVAALFAELRTSRWSLPRVLYIIGIAVMVGIALRPRSLFLFLVVWTSQHWILAAGLASQTPRAEPAPRRGVIRGALHGLNIRPWAVLLFLMVLSVLLLPLFEVEANRQAGTYYGERIFGAIATGLRTSSWVPMLVALGFATGFIHYLLDRSVFRMSDPQVRAAARGLLDYERI